VALYRSPNNLALLLDRALPLALSLALLGALGAPSAATGATGALGRRAGRLAGLAGLAGWRSPFAAVALLLALALFFTFSRGAWLAAAGACAFVVLPVLRRLPAPRRRRLALMALAAGTPLLLLAGALALRVERFRSLLAPEGTAVLRLRLWQSALEMARDHPLGGIGLDQFLYLYPTYMHPDAWREPNLSHPHNLLLDFWLRLGLLGLVALVWAGWKALRRVQERGSGGPDAPPPTLVSSALAWGAAGALLAVLLHGALDNSYFVIDLAYGCWILLLILELATEPGAPAPPAGDAP
jgi:O-antigen ligase